VEQLFGELISNLERAQASVARERIARARGDVDADDESGVLARHRAIFDRSVREMLAEMRDRRFDRESSVAALAYHFRTLTRERVLAIARTRLRRLPARQFVVEEQGLFVRAALAELRNGKRPERARGVESELAAIAAVAARKLDERVAESRDASRAFDVFVDADVDRPLPKVRERANAFLDATDPLIEEMLDFLRGRHGSEIRTAGTLYAALRRAELDDAVKPVSRSRRTLELLQLASFGSSIERKASVDAPPMALLFGTELILPRPDDVRLLSGRESEGILAELSFVQATGRALTILECAPGTPAHLRRPRRGRLGRVIGAILSRETFDARRLRAIDAPEVARERVRRVAAMATLLQLRIDATRALGLSSSEAFHRATRVEWHEAFAKLASVGGDPEVAFDAGVTGLAWTRALRERHDEAFLRHPSTREWLGTVFARQSFELPETFERELGTTDDVAREMRAFFDGRT